MNMAALKEDEINFDQIRLILCVQGYNFQDDRKFIPREIGFWSKNQFGVVPFNCRISYKKLSEDDKSNVKFLCGKLHGIPLDMKANYALLQSDCTAVLKSLYHSMKSSESAKYIGVCRDSHMLSLLYAARLGHLVIDLDKLNMFSKDKDFVPSNKDLRKAMKEENNYSVCKLHKELNIDEVAICAGVKAKFLADHCLNYEENLEKNIIV